MDVEGFVPFEGVGALSNVPTAQRNDIYTAAPPQNIDTALTYDAVLDTSQGEIRVRLLDDCLLYTSPSPRDGLLSRMPSSA